MKSIFKKWQSIGLIYRIMIGIVFGIILATTVPQYKEIGIIGSLFVGALKAIAPVLVFFLVMSAISQHKKGQQTNMGSVLVLYIFGTVSAALVTVAASFAFPVTLVLSDKVAGSISAPSGIGEVLKNILMNVVDNPVNALIHANFIGILMWAIVFGFALRKTSDATKEIFSDISKAVSTAVAWVIQFAPFGIMGLVFMTVSANGIGVFANYVKLLAVLLGSMFGVALIMNPIIVWILLRVNPYPLVLRTLKDSGLYAFFTRSSAANIPVNMELCEELGLDRDTFAVSIPLGATINMSGAAITIAALTLAATTTLGIHVDIPTAIILTVLSAVSACGASGVAGGSLLLIPLACSLFGIPADVAMQVVGVGFIIGVIQDSCETGLNSSTDVLFTAVAELMTRKKAGRKVDYKSMIEDAKKMR